VATVISVMRSEVWQRAQASPRRLVEVPFQTLLPADGAGAKPTILRGVIDLVFLEAGAWVIIDYKTDDRPGEPIAELAAHYLPQLRAYADAWELTTGEHVRELGLYFTTSGRYQAMPPL
jgi:ATP-dependent exoDNAse (exonuclease V) beta subunit